MKIGPLFKWFGSKWQSAKHYPAPRFGAIVEPFAGGAGYSLNYCDRRVYLREIDPLLVQLWSWLINEATQQAILDMPIGLPKGTDIRSVLGDTGQALLMKHWQRTNNAGDCWTISNWDNSPGLWSANTRARVAEQVGAIKHWKLNINLPSYEGPATFFIDPMYQYNYKYRSGLTPHDYGQLAFNCIQAAEIGHQVIVCEAMGKHGERPEWLPFRENHRSVTSRRKADQSHHSNELIWTANC